MSESRLPQTLAKKAETGCEQPSVEVRRVESGKCTPCSVA